MKKHFLFLAFMLSFIPSTYSQESISSKVVFYRENNYYGSAITYKITAGDSVIVRLKNNSFYTYNCKPGVYDFRIDKSQATNVQLNVETGKTYYLRFDLIMGMWASTPELTVVDSISAYSKVRSGSMRELGNTNKTYKRPKNRIGMNLNIGGGFQNTQVATTTNGSESTISFGGGYAFGLKYGHELNKHLDLAFNLNYQSSELKPVLTNAKMSFNRGILSVTPSYILPINDGEKMRLKIGAGLDSYIGTVLNFNMSKLSAGFIDTWNYKSKLGYHFSMIFEMNPSDNWSLNYGLKYYNASYNFENGNISYPQDTKLISPNGSGIDLLMGIYYHF